MTGNAVMHCGDAMYGREWSRLESMVRHFLRRMDNAVGNASVTKNTERPIITAFLCLQHRGWIHLHAYKEEEEEDDSECRHRFDHHVAFLLGTRHPTATSCAPELMDQILIHPDSKTC